MKIDRRGAVKLLGGVSVASLLLLKSGFQKSVLAETQTGETGSDPDFMVLLIYTPRADAESRGYSKWLQDVDNPFFNSVPEIHHYTNWILTNGLSRLFPYTYFDFMVCKGRTAFDRAWMREEVLAFAGGWTKEWGQFPEATAEAMADNYHVYLCERLSPAVLQKTHTVSFTPLTEKVAHTTGSTETWKITESVLGSPHFKYFQVQYHADNAEVTASDNSLQAKIIASPD